MSWGERSCVHFYERNCGYCKGATPSTCNVDCKNYFWDMHHEPDSLPRKQTQRSRAQTGQAVAAVNPVRRKESELMKNNRIKSRKALRKIRKRVQRYDRAVLAAEKKRQDEFVKAAEAASNGKAQT